MNIEMNTIPDAVVMAVHTPNNSEKTHDPGCGHDAQAIRLTTPNQKSCAPPFDHKRTKSFHKAS